MNKNDKIIASVGILTLIVFIAGFTMLISNYIINSAIGAEIYISFFVLFTLLLLLIFGYQINNNLKEFNYIKYVEILIILGIIWFSFTNIVLLTYNKIPLTNSERALIFMLLPVLSYYIPEISVSSLIIINFILFIAIGIKSKNKAKKAKKIEI